MNHNLTFLIISSTNDMRVVNALHSVHNVGKILLIDGGPRKHSRIESEINLKELAEEYHAEYVQNKYEYAAQQYNFGINLIETEWTFIIDSDETLSIELAEWLKNNDYGNSDSYSVKRFNYFLSHRMKHGQFRPDWNIRLFRTSSCRYELRKVHARLLTNGQTGKSIGNLNHETVNNLDEFFLKMVEFSSLEKESRSVINYSSEPKAIIRSILLKFPMQPSLRFVYSYFIRLGFLDGRLGLKLAKCAYFYEIMAEMYASQN